MLHLLVANWRPWHFKLNLSLYQKGGLHVTITSQTDPPAKVASLGCQLATMALQIKPVTVPKRWVDVTTTSQTDPPAKVAPLGCQLATMSLQIKPVTISKRWAARQKLSLNLGRQCIWAELHEPGGLSAMPPWQFFFFFFFFSVRRLCPLHPPVLLPS